VLLLLVLLTLSLTVASHKYRYC